MLDYVGTLFGLQLLLFFCVLLYKLYNVMSGCKQKLEYVYISYAAFVFFWGVGLLIVLSNYDLLASLLFRLESWLFGFGTLLLFAETVITFSSGSRSPFKRYLPEKD